MTEFEDKVLKLLKEILTLLKINKRPNNAVLVPCDKLAEMQAEIKALKNQLLVKTTPKQEAQKK